LKDEEKRNIMSERVMSDKQISELDRKVTPVKETVVDRALSRVPKRFVRWAAAAGIVGGAALGTVKKAEASSFSSGPSTADNTAQRYETTPGGPLPEPVLSTEKQEKEILLPVAQVSVVSTLDLSASKDDIENTLAGDDGYKQLKGRMERFAKEKNLKLDSPRYPLDGKILAGFVAYSEDGKKFYLPSENKDVIFEVNVPEDSKDLKVILVQDEGQKALKPVLKDFAQNKDYPIVVQPGVIHNTDQSATVPLQLTPDGKASAKRIDVAGGLSEGSYLSVSKEDLDSEKMLDGIRLKPIGAKSEWKLQTNIKGLDLQKIDADDIKLRIERLEAEGILDSTKKQVFNFLEGDGKEIKGSFSKVRSRAGIYTEQIVIDDSDPEKTVYNIYNAPRYREIKKLTNPLGRKIYGNQVTITSLYHAIAAKYSVLGSYKGDGPFFTIGVENKMLSEEEKKTGGWNGLIYKSEKDYKFNEKISVTAEYKQP
jgi:hypothetical protein